MPDERLPTFAANPVTVHFMVECSVMPRSRAARATFPPFNASTQRTACSSHVARERDAIVEHPDASAGATTEPTRIASTRIRCCVRATTCSLTLVRSLMLRNRHACQPKSCVRYLPIKSEKLPPSISSAARLAPRISPSLDTRSLPSARLDAPVSVLASSSRLLKKPPASL